jgi:hypothetical protein
MRKFLLLKLVSLMLIGTAWAQFNPKVSQMATAIAKTEGFFVKGTIPNRCHNPGDLRSSIKNAYPGQIGLAKHGYIIFKSDAWGWAGLEKQIQMIIDGESHQYDQSMTFAEIAKVYAASPQWSKTFCKILKISSQLTFEQYFGLAPRVRMVRNEIPVWAPNPRTQMPVLQPMPELLSQVRPESGWLVVPLSEWEMAEAQ